MCDRFKQQSEYMTTRVGRCRAEVEEFNGTGAISVTGETSVASTRLQRRQTGRVSRSRQGRLNGAAACATTSWAIRAESAIWRCRTMERNWSMVHSKFAVSPETIESGAANCVDSQAKTWTDDRGSSALAADGVGQGIRLIAFTFVLSLGVIESRILTDPMDSQAKTWTDDGVRLNRLNGKLPIQNLRVSLGTPPMLCCHLAREAKDRKSPHAGRSGVATACPADMHPFDYGSP